VARCRVEPVVLLGRPSGADELLGRGRFQRHSARSWQGKGRLTLKMCLVQRRAETAKANDAAAASANDVNSESRAMRDEEETLQIPRCALLTRRP
jgi:hypothetical protein